MHDSHVRTHAMFGRQLGNNHPDCRAFCILDFYVRTHATALFCWELGDVWEEIIQILMLPLFMFFWGTHVMFGRQWGI